MSATPSTPPGTTQLHIWIDRIQAGDESARDELLWAFMSQFQGLAQRMLRGFRGVARWERTDDVLQNALVRLDRALRTERPGSVLGFVRLAATQMRRELLDLARHYQGPQGLGAHHASWPPDASNPPPDPADPASDLADRTRWDAVHEEVDRLPPEEHEVVDLLFYAGRTQAEAAAILGISESTVLRRWTAARLKLKSRLGEGDW
jgi:RNA polymerase sigma-70 factor (ECF subfamily)